MTAVYMKRLEKLEQATIIHFLEELSLSQRSGFEYSVELCEVLLRHLLNGDFDEEFLSDTLIGVNDSERKEIYQLARKYGSLCFFQGNIDFWLDSIEGVSLEDSDLICTKILDHFDFLLGLTRDGGEDTLKLLTSFQMTSMADESSIIDFLRNNFGNDEALKSCLIALSRKDGEYIGLTSEEKAILFRYPGGVLCEFSDDGYKRIPAKVLEERLNQKYFGVDSMERTSLENLGSLYSNDLDSFENAIVDIHYDHYYGTEWKKNLKKQN